MTTPKIIDIYYKEISLSAKVHYCTSSEFKACIFYLHGGGLVFGTRDDLPQVYISMLNQAGYTLVALDYPLAPEASLELIQDAVHYSVTYLLTHPEELGQNEAFTYVLFGRSAGAYLALSETARLIAAPADAAYPLPKALLSFYGYHSFDLPEFHKTNAYFSKMAAVSEASVKRLLKPSPITNGPLTERYSIYIYARQEGNWPELVGADSEKANIDEELLRQFPPAFLTASSADQDVPFRESKNMSRMIPGSKFMPVYYLEHDFDRDTSRKEGPDVYRAALAWLDAFLP